MSSNSRNRALLLSLAIAALAVPAAAQTQADNKMSMVWVEMFLRWAHVLFGVLWIGHLYFFNFVQGGFEGKLAAEMKKSVIPELRPRALYWFRWGAAWTWVTGFLLLGLVYYMGYKQWSAAEGHMGAATLGILVVLLGVYDMVAKKLGPMTPAGLGVNLALLAGAIALMIFVGKFDGRSLWIHTGALFGSTMAMNVWMRIWPNQRRIITAIKNGQAPDAAMVALAGARSRHNTYMSVPLIMLMVSNHYGSIYGGTSDALTAINLGALVLVIVVGFLTAKILYTKAAKVTGF